MQGFGATAICQSKEAPRVQRRSYKKAQVRRELNALFTYIMSSLNLYTYVFILEHQRIMARNHQATIPTCSRQRWHRLLRARGSSRQRPTSRTTVRSPCAGRDNGSSPPWTGQWPNARGRVRWRRFEYVHRVIQYPHIHFQIAIRLTNKGRYRRFKEDNIISLEDNRLQPFGSNIRSISVRLSMPYKYPCLPECSSSSLQTWAKSIIFTSGSIFSRTVLLPSYTISIELA